MPVLGICTLVGVLAGLWIPLPVPIECLPFFLLFGGSLAWWLGGNFPLLAVLGFLLAAFHSQSYLQESLPASLVREDILVRGTVIDFPRITGSSTSFLFRVSSAGRERGLPGRILLTSYDRALEFRPGSRWQLLTRLKQPHGLVNPGQRDRAVMLFREQVHATGYVRESPLNGPLDARDWDSWLLRVRAALAGKIADSLESHESLPLLLGITVGVRNLLGKSHWETLRRTGTSHLMAISGLHIGMVALVVWQLGRRLAWLINCGGAAIDAQRLAGMLAAGAALTYGGLAGFSVPTVRAALMAGIVILFTCRYRFYRPVSILAAVLIVALLSDPLAVLSAGFWLSYGAVALLFACLRHGGATETHDTRSGSYLAELIHRCGVVMRNWGAAQLLLGVGLAIPTLVFFGQLSLVAPLANLVAIPAFTILILPASLAGLLLLNPWQSAGAACLKLAADSLTLLFKCLSGLANMPASFWEPGFPHLPALLIAATGVALMLMPRPVPTRLFGLGVTLAAVLSGTPQSTGELRLHVLDVGQGLAVIVRTADKVMVYDAGPAWGDSDAGQKIVVPVLKYLGITTVDMLVISHWDDDHSGGVGSLIKSVPVGRITAPRSKAGNVDELTECRQGMRWNWQSITFEILHPANEAGWSDNNASCVVLITLGESRILLPGDIEAAVEPLLIRRHPLKSLDLLIAPHHGSDTSSGTQFTTVTQPDYVVYSVGYANRWGFPHASVSNRWTEAGSCGLSTADTGALTFIVTAEGGAVPEKPERARWWRPWPLRTLSNAACMQKFAAL
ncbi:MAG TPA: DNA internalization-related competence protein ComEC/Rec2 [Gammaproteobacteria bacterium]|jgi:competence protein ComEC|nr:DNA internalization-related competence protein ComEC/Rec2 [Gammaproteobacteria bacterium]